MKYFILDFGSGNTCKNDPGYIEKMINELAKVDQERKSIIKWQLFKEAGNNIPLYWYGFDYAYNYANKKGFQTTASVFDKKSLDFLLQYEIPFVKIANNQDLYYLIGEIPRKVEVLVSYTDEDTIREYTDNISLLSCISRYPATIKEYESFFEEYEFNELSDHTTNWDLFRKYSPYIYECHYKLDGSTGLDAGDFARIPEQIKEIINLV